jgi:hypothetical protein
MALPAAKATFEDVQDRLRLGQQEFDWEDRDNTGMLRRRVAEAILDAQIKTLQSVGTGNYSSTDDMTAAAIRRAEIALTCSVMLRQRLVILSSRPEEAPPEEYIDLTALQAEISRLERDWREMTSLYATQDLDNTGSGFAMGSVGVDETAQDDYDATDYGLL